MRFEKAGAQGSEIHQTLTNEAVFAVLSSLGGASRDPVDVPNWNLLHHSEEVSHYYFGYFPPNRLTLAHVCLHPSTLMSLSLLQLRKGKLGYCVEGSWGRWRSRRGRWGTAMR